MNDFPLKELGERLLKIQELDSRIRDLKRDIDRLPVKHRLGELEARLCEVGDEKDAKERELEDLEHRQHKLDGELDLLSSKIKAEEEKLFSGTIMNPKELSAIQAEILSLRKHRDDMETEDLELMEEVDRLHREIERAEAAVRTLEEEERVAREAFEAELLEKKALISGIESEREELKKPLDPETVDLYEKLLAEKAGLAVVRIERGRNCGACRIEFSRTQMDRFQHEDGIFRCDYCRRILVK